MTQNNRRNYYRILHVQRDAPTEVIKSSYRTLMQRLRMHPDLGGDHWNAALLNEAYAVLTDPERRAAYDRSMPEPARQQATDYPGSRPTGPAAHSAAASGQRRKSSASCPFCHADHAEPRSDDDPICASCSSPLSRPPSGSGRADWVRAADRVPQDLELRFWTGWPQAPGYEGRLLDLSLTGLRFATGEALLPDQFLKIDCASFQAIARVVHARPMAPSGKPLEIGAEFLTLRFARSKGAFVSERA